jgi:hypothetical protein
MLRVYKIDIFGLLTFGAVAFFSASGVQSQQPNPVDFNQTYQVAFTKAREDCAALWSNHAFDSLRIKIPLGDEKPTFSMLKMLKGSS